MKAKHEEKPVYADIVLVVGARKFVFPQEVQLDTRVHWWGPVRNDEGSHEILPAGLRALMVLSSLARKVDLEKIAASRSLEFVEFTSEEEVIPRLKDILNIKSVPQSAPKVETPKTELTARDPSLFTNQVIDIPISRICPMKGQPRVYFNQERLRGLSRSIQRSGQRVPIIVTPLVDDKDYDYQIKDGERRWRASKLIAKPTVRAIVEDPGSAADMFRESAVCNFGREDHTDLEIALALKRIKKEEEITYQELSDLFSRSIPWVTQHLSLLKLSSEVQKMMSKDLPEEKQIQFSYAIEIAKLNTEKQDEAARYIVDNKLNLLRTRHYIRTLLVEFGTSLKIRKRTPDDEVQVIKAFIDRILIRSDELLNIPGFTYKQIFNERSSIETDKMSKELGKVIGLLEKMKRLIATKGK